MLSHFKELKGGYELEKTAIKIYMNFLQKVIHYLRFRVREFSFYSPFTIIILQIYLKYIVIVL
jgi:hypothetical protein